MKRRRLAGLAEFTFMASVALPLLLLLVYVSFSETKRTDETFFVEKLAVQNNVLAVAIESFLRRDLPLQQYFGFDPRADRLLASDQTITSLFVVDSDGDIVFGRGDAAVNQFSTARAMSRRAGMRDNVGMPNNDVSLHAQRLFVTTPLANRYQDVGALVIAMAADTIGTAVDHRFAMLLLPTIVLALVFAAFACPPPQGVLETPQTVYLSRRRCRDG